MDKSEEDRLDAQIDKMFDEVTEVRMGEDGKPVPDFTKVCHDFRAAQRQAGELTGEWFFNETTTRSLLR